jgi:hypothetical protein
MSERPVKIEMYVEAWLCNIRGHSHQSEADALACIKRAATLVERGVERQVLVRAAVALLLSGFTYQKAGCILGVNGMTVKNWLQRYANSTGKQFEYDVTDLVDLRKHREEWIRELTTPLGKRLKDGSDD